jgi:hypothetical protein
LLFVTKYLRIRIEETHQKYDYQRLADSLSINNNIDDLKYRVWFMPSFGNVRFLEIHLNSNELNGNKAIIYHLDNNIWKYEGSFNVKIAAAEILQIDKEKWHEFIKKQPMRILPIYHNKSMNWNFDSV